jgi:hypothetical protein
LEEEEEEKPLEEEEEEKPFVSKKGEEYHHIELEVKRKKSDKTKDLFIAINMK